MAPVSGPQRVDSTPEQVVSGSWTAAASPPPQGAEMLTVPAPSLGAEKLMVPAPSRRGEDFFGPPSQGEEKLTAPAPSRPATDLLGSLAPRGASPPRPPRAQEQPRDPAGSTSHGEVASPTALAPPMAPATAEKTVAKRAQEDGVKAAVAVSAGIVLSFACLPVGIAAIVYGLYKGIQSFQKRSLINQSPALANAPASKLDALTGKTEQDIHKNKAIRRGLESAAGIGVGVTACVLGGPLGIPLASGLIGYGVWKAIQCYREVRGMNQAREQTRAQEQFQQFQAAYEQGMAAALRQSEAPDARAFS